MSSTKTIQVNKDFFSLSGKTAKRHERRKKPEHPKTLAHPTKLRKEFMKRVQAFNDKKHRDELSKVQTSDAVEIVNNDINDVNEFNKEFDRSVDFMQQLAARRAKHRETQRSRKNKQIAEPIAEPQIEIRVDTPDEWSVPVKSQINNTQQHQHVQQREPLQQVSFGPEPPYSSLRCGTKPTYRTWLHQTQKIPQEHKQKLDISGEKLTDTQTLRSQRLQALKEARCIERNQKPCGKRMMQAKITTRTVKRKLGKSGRHVSVLIKSRETRKKIQTDKVKLGQTSIIDIKRYLRKRNLIKAGSCAPNDVLRKMYEQCILTGDVSNKNANVLIHNYMHDEH